MTEWNLTDQMRNKCIATTFWTFFFFWGEPHSTLMLKTKNLNKNAMHTQEGDNKKRFAAPNVSIKKNKNKNKKTYHPACEPVVLWSATAASAHHFPQSDRWCLSVITSQYDNFLINACMA